MVEFHHIKNIDFQYNSKKLYLLFKNNNKILDFGYYNVLPLFHQQRQKPRAMTTVDEIQKALSKKKLVMNTGYGVITMFEVTDHTIKIKTAWNEFYRFKIGALGYFLRQTEIR